MHLMCKLPTAAGLLKATTGAAKKAAKALGFTRTFMEVRLSINVIYTTGVYMAAAASAA